MSIYLTSAINAIGSGVYAVADAFMNFSPLGKAATIAAIALPIILNANAKNVSINQDGRIEKGRVVHTWNLKDHTVKVIRLYRDNSLVYKVISNDGDNYHGHIDLPANKINEFIKKLHNMTPILGPHQSIEFATVNYPSKLDPNKKINNDNWAVTLVDTGESKLSDPTSWGGHAILIIEGVSNFHYFAKIAHISSPVSLKNTLPFVSSYAKVEYEDIILEKFHRFSAIFKGKSETWIRSNNKIQEMMDEIQGEFDLEIRLGRPNIPFSIGGCDLAESTAERISTFVMRKLCFPKIQLEPDHSDNCITWARKKLRTASIHLPRPWGFFPTTPKDYTSPI